MFSKVVEFFHRHPAIKTTIVGAVGAALTAAASGAYGQKAAVIAGAALSVASLWIKRPKDATPVDKGEVKQ